MENENVTITLTVAQWQGILGALNHAPFAAVTQIGAAINSLQSQASVQITALSATDEKK